MSTLANMERVMIFIDGSNLYHGLKACVGHARLDFRRFSELLCGPRRLVHTNYYTVPLRQSDNPSQYAGQQKFLSRLRQIPRFTTHLGRLVDRQRQETCPDCSKKFSVGYQTEKGVDVQIAAHMLAFAFDNQYDRVILISQDGDFAPVVEEVRRFNKHVENADFALRLPSYLSKSCSAVVPLDAAFLASCLF